MTRLFPAPRPGRHRRYTFTIVGGIVTDEQRGNVRYQPQYRDDTLIYVAVAAERSPAQMPGDVRPRDLGRSFFRDGIARKHLD